MSNFYTFLKGILATMLLLFVPNMALAHSGGITSQPNSSKAYRTSTSHVTGNDALESGDAVSNVLPLGQAVTSLDEIDSMKTYVLYNPTDKVYAVSNPDQAVNIWAANVPGEDVFNATAITFDPTSPHSSWRVIYKNDSITIFNMGAKKYLDTPHEEGNGGSASKFTENINPLTWVALGDGKFAFSATGNQYDYFCAAKQFADNPMANWSSDDHGCCWQFIENPNVPAVDAPEAPAASFLAGKYTAKFDKYTSDNPDFTDDYTHSYNVTLEVNAKGEVLIPGTDFIGRVSSIAWDENDNVTRTDSCYVGTYDEAAQTVTFKFPEPLNGHAFTITDLNTYDGWSECSDFTATIGKSENGSIVLTVKDPVSFSINGNPVMMQGLRFRAEGAEPEAVKAPAELAGSYKVKTGTPVVASNQLQVSVADSYKATVTVAADGTAHMTGLIGTPRQSAYDMDGMTTIDSCYVGTYNEEAQTITFVQPADFPIYDASYNSYQLQAPITLHMTANEDGSYNLSTDDDIVYDLTGYTEDGDEVKTTVTFSGATFSHVNPVTIAKEDLVGKWNLTYKTMDLATGLTVDADTTASFQIIEKDGDLFLTELGGSKSEWPVVYGETGIEIPVGSNTEGTETILSDVYGMSYDPVKFAYTSATGMELETGLTLYLNGGDDMFIVMSGTAEKEIVYNNLTDEELCGTWKISVPEVDNETGIPTGNTTDVTFDITKDETNGTYAMANFGGSTHPFAVERTNGGIVVKATSESSEDGMTSFIMTSNSWGMADVQFAFNEDKTMQLATNMLVANEKGVWEIENGTVAEKQPKAPEVTPAPGHYTTLPSHIVYRTNGQNISLSMGVIAYYKTDENQKGGMLMNGQDEGIKVDADSIVIDLPAADLENKPSLQIQIIGYDEEGNAITLNGQSPVVVEYTADTTEEPEVLPLGEAVTSLEDLDPTKTYVLYNPTDKVYAVSNPDQSTNIWAANVPGEAEFNATAIDFNAADAHSSWMVVKKGDKLMIYNMGAKKYLDTPHEEGNGGSASTFTEEVNPLVYVELGDGKFAFSATGNQFDYFCAAKQFTENPMANWSSDDHGSCWMFVENPNVAADAEVAGVMTGIDTVSEAPAAQGIYTINGVKLQVTDVRKLQKGLYIVNGKKVLVK